ncbi:hypothetical protein CBR_g930 [Chara braunii]|uniref:Reverse transcriptase/retrotransposon-derived protein RNase H-like domain-containing protein n=1 Tax=Chara braunii TaxID=69332 RepID=A0A388KCS1_CHABU|nr:hypothetical protein CBR_g930 [Chara braunii]|eukprot:GBG67806.1 hypothetical protein CBR_g930 [Chara braunii]
MRTAAMSTSAARTRKVCGEQHVNEEVLRGQEVMIKEQRQRPQAVVSKSLNQIEAKRTREFLPKESKMGVAAPSEVDEAAVKRRECLPKLVLAVLEKSQPQMSEQTYNEQEASINSKEGAQVAGGGEQRKGNAEAGETQNETHASDTEKPYLQALLDSAIEKEQEAENERKEQLLKSQEAILEIVPSLTKEQCGEQLQSILTAIVQVRRLEDHTTQIADVFAELKTLQEDLTDMTSKYRDLMVEVAALRQAQVTNPLPLPPGSGAAIETNVAPLTVSTSTASLSVMANPSGPATGADSVVAVTSNEAGNSATAAAPRSEPASAGPSYAGPHVDQKAVQIPSKYDDKEDIESWINSMREYFEVLGTQPETQPVIMGMNVEPVIGRIVVVYLDDILIFNKSIEEHLKHLEEVLTILKKMQLHLNLEKYEFGKDSVIHLGHRLSAAGLEPESTKVEVISNWPQPVNIREMRSFLGLPSYYRKFVPRFSIVARPLSRLTSKNVPYFWDTACTNAFQALKDALVSYPVLRLVDPKLTFVVTTDASQYGIGAVLQQDDGDGLRSLEFYSKRMPNVKVATSTYMCELYALRMALDHWKYYLLGHHFKVFSDHETLK